jgi:hypothetical protein
MSGIRWSGGRGCGKGVSGEDGVGGRLDKGLEVERAGVSVEGVEKSGGDGGGVSWGI